MGMTGPHRDPGDPRHFAMRNSGTSWSSPMAESRAGRRLSHRIRRRRWERRMTEDGAITVTLLGIETSDLGVERT